jgi:hypothetical protein
MPLPGQIRKLPIPNLLGANQDFQSLRRFHGGGRYGPRFSEIKSLEEDNFLRFAGFRVYKCPVFGARGNRYNVSEVKDRRDRSNELYEQVAALG